MADEILPNTFVTLHRLPTSPGLKLFASRSGRILRNVIIVLMFAVVVYSAIYTVAAYRDIQASIGLIDNALRLG